jgi:hypothetical protein
MALLRKTSHWVKDRTVPATAPLKTAVAKESRRPIVCYVSILENSKPIVAKVAPRLTSSEKALAVVQRNQRTFWIPNLCHWM